MPKYAQLTKYIDLFQQDDFGEWAKATGNGMKEDPFSMPYVNYTKMVRQFKKDFYAVATMPELNDYREFLRKKGISGSVDSMKDIDVNHLDGLTTLALLMFVIRADRFAEGTVLDFLRDGTITRWLEHLQSIDAE